MWFTDLNGMHSHTCSQSHLETDPTDLPDPYTTVERVNMGYKGNNIQIQCRHIKERRWKKQTVKNIKIDRIKSEDIVADIKDTTLHCQLFKVRAPLFFNSIYISFTCNLKCTSEKQAAKKIPQATTIKLTEYM